MADRSLTAMMLITGYGAAARNRRPVQGIFAAADTVVMANQDRPSILIPFRPTRSRVSTEALKSRSKDLKSAPGYSDVQRRRYSALAQPDLEGVTAPVENDDSDSTDFTSLYECFLLVYRRNDQENLSFLFQVPG